MTLEEMQAKYISSDGKVELEELLNAAVFTRSILLEELEEIDKDIEDYKTRLENFK